MNARADKDELWKQVDQLLQRRPGWKFQAISTPGVPPVWYFGREDQPDLSVTVNKGSICLYEMASDHEFELWNTRELVAWLKAHKPGALQPQRGKAADKIKGRSLFKWE